jgi:hypothetical protein
MLIKGSTRTKEEAMHIHHIAMRQTSAPGFVRPWKAACNRLARLLHRLRSRQSKVRVSALDDNWLRVHERESRKRGANL